MLIPTELVNFQPV